MHVCVASVRVCVCPARVWVRVGVWICEELYMYACSVCVRVRTCTQSPVIKQQNLWTLFCERY